MSITTIVKSLYPKVPALAGVPALLRSGAQIFDTLTLGFFGAGELVNSILGTEAVRWGVFDQSGKQIAQYDSVLMTEYRDDSNISDYPVERGSFAAYNKVDMPFLKSVTLTCSGDIEKRNAFQNDLRDARRSLTLYTIVTEDATYTSCNLVSISWTRTATKGAHRVEAKCEFQEVREKGTTAFSQPAIPSGASLRDMGQLQPIEDNTIDVSGVV
jgi:hypothetical protein